MRTLAESLYTANPSAYAQYLDEGETGVTQNNYFRIASLERLGTAQDAQFQSGDQYGSSWHWGSKCTAVGACDASATPTSNSPADMPRMYGNNNSAMHDDYYNWYAATAESGNFASNANVVDSICPSGWQLPVGGKAEELSGGSYKSWYNLLFEAYGLDTSAKSVRTALGIPLSFTVAGFYLGNQGIVEGVEATDRRARLWTQTGHNPSTGYARILEIRTQLHTGDGQGDSAKTNGLSIRCVKK